MNTEYVNNFVTKHKNALCQIWDFTYKENEFELLQGVGSKQKTGCHNLRPEGWPAQQ